MNAYLQAMRQAKLDGFHIPEIELVYYRLDNFTTPRYFLNEEEQITPTSWNTYRTVCGSGRITAHPEWSSEKPWASYWYGSAGPHFETLQEAQLYFVQKYAAFLRLE